MTNMVLHQIRPNTRYEIITPAPPHTDYILTAYDMGSDSPIHGPTLFADQHTLNTHLEIIEGL
jgi:hypothetical protein